LWRVVKYHTGLSVTELRQLPREVLAEVDARAALESNRPLKNVVRSSTSGVVMSHEADRSNGQRTDLEKRNRLAAAHENVGSDGAAA
jgi:hypothetical protein